MSAGSECKEGIKKIKDLYGIKGMFWRKFPELRTQRPKPAWMEWPGRGDAGMRGNALERLTRDSSLSQDDSAGREKIKEADSSVRPPLLRFTHVGFEPTEDPLPAFAVGGGRRNVAGKSFLTYAHHGSRTGFFRTAGMQ
jgi:hypothetical protein